MANYTKITLDIDNETLACEYKIAEVNAVILHGAGPATTYQKYLPIADELVRQGIGVVLFDFSGHGQSRGKLAELSLSRRAEQAKQVINKLIPQSSPLYLAGFSMSGQTACDLLPIYRERIRALLLGCPAAYRADVSDIPFGDATFTAKIREENSWQMTDATKKLADFDGKTVIAIGSDDTVIPKGVIRLFQKRAKQLVYKEYEGATHAFASWLEEHPKELAELIAQLVDE